MLLVTFEPNETWSGRDSVSLANSELTEAGTESQQLKANEELLDAASAVAATLNNIGPGLGVVGPTNNYAHFSQGAKLLFVWLMMLGRVEVFSVLVLFFPTFWRRV
ncbi:MAG: potassium transporter TrkG [Pseudomonadota bacterium]